jgi:Ca2+-binding RTX toxin-like protein
VQDWFHFVNHQLTSVEFADGTVWTNADINAMKIVLFGTGGNDTVSGYSGQNNILIGGAGDELLTGNNGNDIYVWSLGDGNDVIDDYSYNKQYYGETGVLTI